MPYMYDAFDFDFPWTIGMEETRREQREDDESDASENKKKIDLIYLHVYCF